jgi:hypothetical protein
MSSKNKLSLNLFEANLKRHPSVKGLFDENGDLKNPTDSKNEFLLLNIINQSDEKDNDINDVNKGEVKKKRNASLPIKIDRVKEKIVDNKDTFFVEMNDENRKEILKNNIDKKKSKFSQPLSYELNDSQKKLDKDVTNAMSEGKDYSEIEIKFVNHLKKK